MEPQAPNPAPQPTPQAPVTPVTPVAASQQPAIETVPSEWPGAFGLYKHSKAAVKANLSGILVSLAVSIVASIVLSSIVGALKLGEAVNNLMSLILTAILGPASTLVILAGVDRQRLSFGEAFTKGAPKILHYLANYILLGLAAVISLVLLIIPFFFIMPRLVLAPYFLMRNNLGPIEAIKTSWERTKGNLGKVYGIIGVFFLLGLLCITIIGIPFAAYFAVMYSAAFAILTAYISPSAAPQPIAAQAYVGGTPVQTQPTNPMPPQAPTA